MKNMTTGRLIGTVMLALIFVLLAYLTAMSWIFEPSGSLTNQELAVKQIRAEIFEKFFQIFVTVATIVSGFAVAVTFAVFGHLRSQVSKEIEENIFSLVTTSQAYTTIKSFVQLCMDDYWDFEGSVDKVLTGETVSSQERQLASRYCERALAKSRIGLEVYERMSEDQKKLFLASSENMTALLNILNHRFYARASICLLNTDRRTIGELSDLEEEGRNLLVFAGNALKIGSKESISGCFDSVITCLYVISNLSNDKNLRLWCIKEAQKFISKSGLSRSASFAHPNDVSNVRKVLSAEAI